MLRKKPEMQQRERPCEQTWFETTSKSFLGIIAHFNIHKERQTLQDNFHHLQVQEDALSKKEQIV